MVFSGYTRNNGWFPDYQTFSGDFTEDLDSNAKEAAKVVSEEEDNKACKVDIDSLKGVLTKELCVLYL